MVRAPVFSRLLGARRPAGTCETDEMDGMDPMDAAKEERAAPETTCGVSTLPVRTRA